MAYTPRYVEITDVPVQIPDDYSDEQKYEALEVAEGSAELDLNEGEEFDSEIPTPIMEKIKTAIKQKATAELAEGAESPDDVTLGDLSDDGSTKADYADIFDSQYEEIIMKIRNSGVLDSESDKSAYVYTTRGGDERLEGENIHGDSGGGSYMGGY
jgi:hypothetical protein